MDQRARFVYQDNVLIERLIFYLGIRCERPKEVVELLTGAPQSKTNFRRIAHGRLARPTKS